MTFAKRDLWQAVESLNKVRGLEKHRGWLQRIKDLNEKYESEKLISKILKKPHVFGN